jgi:hypothetical protein
MVRTRLLPAATLAAGLLVSAVTSAQPPAAPGQPQPGGPAVREGTVPVLPKSVGMFVTLKVSDLSDQPDLKPVLAQLAKQPDALAGITEVIGVSPLEIDRVTLFFPQLAARGPAEPVLVVTTREPFNEARVLKNLKADPVFDGDSRRGRSGRWGVGGGSKPTVKFVPADDPPGLVDPKGNFLPPKGFEPKSLPREKKDDDPCASAPDGGPGDPLFYALDRGPFAALFLIDNRTLVFLPGEPGGDFSNMALLAALLKKNATGPLADAIAAAGRQTFAAGVHLTPLFREFDRRVPVELVPYTALLSARTAVLVGSVERTAKLNLELTFDDAAAAKRAAPVLEEGIATVAEQLAQFADAWKDERRAFEKAAAPVLGAFASALKKASVKATGSTVTATAEMDAGPAAAKALGELLQAMHGRKKAERRTNNLKQIGIALHAYHDTFGHFPSNVYGPKGEPLLSWRVQLLPYLEEENLYRQFNMNEAWDGPNNKKLIEQMPKLYQAPDREHAKGETFYQGFIGDDPQNVPPPKGLFGRPWLQRGEKNGIRIFSITDGTSNTIAVIEAGRGVIWSKPDDLPFGGPVPPLGERGWDRTPALRFDGSVFLFPTNMKPEKFWPYVTINGGEIVEDVDDDRPPRGIRPLRPGEAPPANNPVKQPEVRELKEKVTKLLAASGQAQHNARLAAADAEQTLKLFCAGAVTAEDAAKAIANVEAARKFARVCEAELEAAEAQLDAANKLPGKEPTSRRPEK